VKESRLSSRALALARLKPQYRTYGAKIIFGIDPQPFRAGLMFGTDRAHG
jgi:hypothetical protein